MTPHPDIVLVHGLWHQPAHFESLAARLRQQGLRVEVPLLHRGSLAADTAAVQEVVDGLGSAPVVVAHSYGGAVATGLTGVSHLVLVAAFVPDEGESCASLGGEHALVNSVFIRNDDGTTSIPALRAHDVFYADCNAELSDRAAALLVPQAPGHGRGVPTSIGWRTAESTYVVCEEDKALSAELQRRMSLRCTHKIALASGHSPFISRPNDLGDIIMRVAARRT